MMVEQKSIPLWGSDGIPALQFKKWNRDQVVGLRNAIEKKELVLVENNCLCQNEHEFEDIVISEKDRFGLPIPQILCSKCGLIRSGVVFDERSNDLFYEKFYRGIYTTSVPSDVFFQDQVNTGQRIFDLIKRYVKDSEICNVVEIGCGAGGILYPFFKNGKTVAGYDFDEQYLEKGRNYGLNLIHGDFYDQAAVDSCDLIIMNHVFEHLLHPLQVIQKLLPKLRFGKYLYVQVPGIYCISEIYPDPLTYFQNAHVYNFYEQYLRVLFERFGMKVIYGDERCTFICQKISDIIPNVDCIYDQCLSDYPKKNVAYLLDCKNRYDESTKTTFKTKLFKIACALGWKRVRPYIRRNKSYSKKI